MGRERRRWEGKNSFALNGGVWQGNNKARDRRKCCKKEKST